MELDQEISLTRALNKINHLLVNLFEYNLDGLEASICNLSELYGDRTPAAIFPKSKVIAVDPVIFEYKQLYSDYLNRYVYGDPLHHILLHEITHYLVYTDQINADGYEDEELFCEAVAEQYNKILHGDYE